jgi:nitrogen regulatory protein P-II 1
MSATYRKITAIIRVDVLERVEAALRELHVGGVSISPVKGYGEYTDFFAGDWMSPYVRVEIFTSAARATGITEAVVAAASTGTRGDGICAVHEVESVLRIRSRALVPPTEI